MPDIESKPAEALQPATEEKLVLTFFDLVNHMQKNAEAMAAESGLTVNQWLVLLQIAGDPNFSGPRADDTGILASEIASARGLTRASISPLISALVRRRLVRQKENPNDRRQKRLYPTAAGLRALRRIEPWRRGANRKLFEAFAEDDRETLLRLSRRCLRRLTGCVAEESES